MASVIMTTANATELDTATETDIVREISKITAYIQVTNSTKALEITGAKLIAIVTDNVIVVVGDIVKALHVQMIKQMRTAIE